MVVKKIYKNRKIILRVYRRRKIVYSRDPITFYEIADGKLIILGAITTNILSDNLYIDCEPKA